MAFYIGLMSGTSMDGIDAALVDVSSNTLIGGITKKYSERTTNMLQQLLNGADISLKSICQLDTLIGREFASAVHELLSLTKIQASEIVAVGSHGQTVCHDTTDTIPYTLQLGCAHTIASQTGITVVADFRTRDLVNGGQGAPFAPIYHQELFQNHKSPLAVVNIGGIANITVLTPKQPTTGWDIGPGNCLIDAWNYQHQGSLYDADGSWARTGTIIPSLLNTLLADPFFQQASPKSIGKEYYSTAWLNQYLDKVYRPEDIQATLTALTAHSIAQTIAEHESAISALYLCGGGTHNTYLHQLLSELLPEVLVKSIAEIGVSPDYLEAMMFAWLASKTLHQIPIDLSSITGAKTPSILGAIYP